MTDRQKALEAARRIAKATVHTCDEFFEQDAIAVASFLLSSPDPSGWKEAVEAAARFCEEQASIWKEGGGVQIVWAAKSLARGIRALSPPVAGDG